MANFLEDMFVLEKNKMIYKQIKRTPLHSGYPSYVFDIGINLVMDTNKQESDVLSPFFLTLLLLTKRSNTYWNYLINIPTDYIKFLAI